MQLLQDVDVVTLLAVVFAAGGGWWRLKHVEKVVGELKRDVRDIRDFVPDLRRRAGT